MYAHSDHRIHEIVRVRQTNTEEHTGSWGRPNVAVGGCEPKAWHRALHLYQTKLPAWRIPPPCFPSIRCREDTRNTEVYFKNNL